MTSFAYEKVLTKETRYAGRLDAAQLRAIIEKAVMSEVGLLPTYDVGVSIYLKLEGDATAPEFSFVLVHDHLYSEKLVIRDREG